MNHLLRALHLIFITLFTELKNKITSAPHKQKESWPSMFFWQPGMVVHTCNPIVTGGWNKFQVSRAYIVRPCLKHIKSRTRKMSPVRCRYYAYRGPEFSSGSGSQPPATPAPGDLILFWSPEEPRTDTQSKDKIVNKLTTS